MINDKKLHKCNGYTLKSNRDFTLSDQIGNLGEKIKLKKTLTFLFPLWHLKSRFLVASGILSIIKTKCISIVGLTTYFLLMEQFSP